MADNKGSAELETGSDKDGWGQDVRDMHRLGKKEVDLGYCIGAMSNMGCRQEFTRNFGMISPSLVLCPKNSAYDVFVHFEANGGWSLGPAYLVSQVTIIYCNLGSD
ncbi:hypothetical protein LTR33_012020, partial [Friedmanniomyces endolithicus]